MRTNRAIETIQKGEDRMRAQAFRSGLDWEAGIAAAAELDSIGGSICNRGKGWGQLVESGLVRRHQSGKIKTFAEPLGQF